MVKKKVGSYPFNFELSVTFKQPPGHEEMTQTCERKKGNEDKIAH